MANHMNEDVPTSVRDIAASSVDRFSKLVQDLEEKIEHLSVELNLASRDLAAARTLVAGAIEAADAFSGDEAKVPVEMVADPDDVAYQKARSGRYR